MPIFGYGCDSNDLNCNCESDQDECDFWYGPCEYLAPEPTAAPDASEGFSMIAGQLAGAFGLVTSVGRRRRLLPDSAERSA